MQKISRNVTVLALGGLALLTMGGAAVLAGGPDEDGDRIRDERKIRIVTVDEDGDTHAQVYEFGPGEAQPFLGVMAGRADGEGVRVDDVVADSGAERAGLQRGDVIVRFDGEPLKAPWDLTTRVLRSKPGDRVDLEVLRDGERLTLTAEIGEREGPGVFVLPELSPEHLRQLEKLGEMDLDFDFDGPHLRHFRFAGRPKLGVQLVQPTADLREHYGAPRDAGVIVSKVLPGTPAEESDVRVGDLIVAADGEPVKDVGDLIHALSDKNGEAIELGLVRDGQAMTLSVFIPEPAVEEFGGPEADFVLPAPPPAPRLRT